MTHESLLRKRNNQMYFGYKMQYAKNNSVYGMINSKTDPSKKMCKRGFTEDQKRRG